MRASDELTAATGLYRAALRAKAREPLKAAKFVDLKKCKLDANGAITNANELIGELKQQLPALFEQPPVLKPPEPPPQEDRTTDAFEMTKEEFDNVWASRFPWTK